MIEITQNTVWTEPVVPGQCFHVHPGITFRFNYELQYGMDSRMADDGGLIVTILGTDI